MYSEESLVAYLPLPLSPALFKVAAILCYVPMTVILGLVSMTTFQHFKCAHWPKSLGTLNCEGSANPHGDPQNGFHYWNSPIPYWNLQGLRQPRNLEQDLSWWMKHTQRLMLQRERSIFLIWVTSMCLLLCPFHPTSILNCIKKNHST